MLHNSPYNIMCETQVCVMGGNDTNMMPKQANVMDGNQTNVMRGNHVK